ncbi:transcriptional regulator PpsR [Falsiroseomonas oryzae]|uniref:transcriptional regulator PpsR n=1 Tax=Falsiroseomonas oryzae TaxID=2766473 RepID=UPI0022EB3936|nr:transcriptional regulator PpsR [Roseomonas sp. MO-31]
MKLFRSPKTSLGHLDAEAAAGLVVASADLALVLDEAGSIRDVGFGSNELAHDLSVADGWVGRPWIDTVSRDSRSKVEALLGVAQSDAPRWRHVNHVALEGASLPILCSVAPLGRAGRRVVFGRDLRPLSQLQQRLVEVQQSMERDYSRLRQAETRYRLLFQMSVDPLLVLDAESLRVLEANPPAQKLFMRSVRRLPGRPLPEAFAPEDRPTLQTLLATLRSAGRADELRVRLADDGPEVIVSASTFRQEGGLLLLVRLEIADATQNAESLPDSRARLLKVLDGVPDAFVVTDADGGIISANSAFLDMVQLTAEDQLRGAPLDRWLGRQSVEFEVLVATLRSRGAVRLYGSTLRGELGSLTDVEISGVSVLHAGQQCFGFSIRDVGPRVRPPTRTGNGATRSVEQLTELIGRVPLKDLVREATDAIERLCIEAALDLTGDNRASAAEMLGLSRQSLYVKLRRYGLGDLGAEDGGED